MKLCLLLVVSLLSQPRLAQEEHAAIACDNSGAKNTEHRVHDCKCERAQKDHCDPEGVKSPKGACALYCKPDACDCAGPCVPS